MSLQEEHASAVPADRALPVLGALGMLGAPLMFVPEILLGGEERIPATLEVSFQLLYLGGWLCSAVGMRRARVTGEGKEGALLLGVQIIGLGMAAAFSLWEPFEPGTGIKKIVYHLTDAAWPLSHLFMLVVGGLVLRAKVWDGWRVVPCFVIGLALPGFFAAASVWGKEEASSFFGALITMGFLALGYAVYSSKGVPHRSEAGNIAASLQA